MTTINKYLKAMTDSTRRQLILDFVMQMTAVLALLPPIPAVSNQHCLERN
jgi:hypothetical protein